MLNFKKFSTIKESLEIHDNTRFSEYFKNGFENSLELVFEEIIHNIEAILNSYGFEVFRKEDMVLTYSNTIKGRIFFSYRDHKFLLVFKEFNSIELWDVTAADEDLVVKHLLGANTGSYYRNLGLKVEYLDNIYKPVDIKTIVLTTVYKD